MAQKPSGEALDLLRQSGATKPPIDIERVARFCGIQVQVWKLCPKKICGFLYRGPCRIEICVNGVDPLVRRRFTIAHELGHFHYGDAGDVLFACEGIADRGPGRQLTERRVNAFAAELLMPEPLIQMAVDIGDSSKAMSRRFLVSEEAMRFRLNELALT